MRFEKLIIVFLFCCINAGGIFSKLASLPSESKFLLDQFRGKYNEVFHSLVQKIVELSREPLHSPEESELLAKLSTWTSSDFGILTTDEVLHAIEVGIHSVRRCPRYRDTDFVKPFIENFKKLTGFDASEIDPEHLDFKERIARIAKTIVYNDIRRSFCAHILCDIESSVIEQIDLSKGKKEKAFPTLKTRIAHVFALLNKPELCQELDDRIGKYHSYDLDKILDDMVTPEFKEELNDVVKSSGNDLYIKEIIKKFFFILDQGFKQIVDELIIKHGKYFTELRVSLIQFKEEKCEGVATSESLGYVDRVQFKKFLEIIGIEDHNDPRWDKVNGIVNTHHFVRAMPKYTPEFYEELKSCFNLSANRA